MLPVRCLSAEKEKGVSIHLHNKHFRHRRISKMLKMFIVHAPASPFGGSRFICRQAAPYALLVSYLRQKCYGVTSGNQPFVNLRSEHLFLRYAYRSGTIFSSAVGSVKQHSADIYAWCLKIACLRCSSVNRQKNHKNHSFHISISLSHRVSCSVFFIPENSFFGHSSF